MEKEMATHFCVLAWRIPGTGEPGGLPSMGLQSRTRLKQLSGREAQVRKGWWVSEAPLESSPHHKEATFNTLA